VFPVNVDSLTKGERIDVTDVFAYPIVGVADGLIVVDFNEHLAFWSPTDGLVPLDQLGDTDTVVAASGDLVVVVSSGQVRLLNIASGEYVGSSFQFPEVSAPITSACLSPDGEHVIVVGRTGEAVVANTATGEVIVLRGAIRDYSLISVQPKHGIGWTTNDQLVLIGEDGFSTHVFGFDIEKGEGFVVTELEGPEEWWLTASGTMC
jgi:hypothetical protein